MVKQKTIIRVIDTYLDKSHQSLSIHLSFPKVEQAFNDFHKETCDNKIRKTEKGVIIDKDGNKIYEKTDRSRDHVSWNTSKLKDLYDDYGELNLAHNHPRGDDRIVAECLSFGDINFLFAHKHRPYGKRPDGSEGFLTEEPVYILKSISCESPNGSRMTLTRGDKFNRENEGKATALGSSLEHKYVEYMHNYFSAKSEIRKSITPEQLDKEFRKPNGSMDFDKYREYLSQEALKKVGRFEDSKEFKQIQKGFRENDCLLTMDFPYDYTVKE